MFGSHRHGARHRPWPVGAPTGPPAVCFNELSDLTKLGNALRYQFGQYNDETFRYQNTGAPGLPGG